ncbi:MAG: hypothetical protein KKG59_04630 [Nanoarchaeota archaeon]|nr:hypothetical protein [Nanoarchaeota archaeon]
MGKKNKNFLESIVDGAIGLVADVVNKTPKWVAAPLAFFATEAVVDYMFNPAEAQAKPPAADCSKPTPEDLKRRTLQDTHDRVIVPGFTITIDGDTDSVYVSERLQAKKACLDDKISFSPKDVQFNLPADMVHAIGDPVVYMVWDQKDGIPVRNSGRRWINGTTPREAGLLPDQEYAYGGVALCEDGTHKGIAFGPFFPEDCDPCPPNPPEEPDKPPLFIPPTDADVSLTAIPFFKWFNGQFNHETAGYVVHDKDTDCLGAVHLRGEVEGENYEVSVMYTHEDVSGTDTTPYGVHDSHVDHNQLALRADYSFMHLPLGFDLMAGLEYIWGGRTTQVDDRTSELSESRQSIYGGIGREVLGTDLTAAGGRVEGVNRPKGVGRNIVDRGWTLVGTADADIASSVISGVEARVSYFNMDREQDGYGIATDTKRIESQVFVEGPSWNSFSVGAWGGLDWYSATASRDGEKLSDVHSTSPGAGITFTYTFGGENE